MRVLCMLLMVLAMPVAAQTGQQSGHAVLHGVAVDSLRGGLLRGAALRVTGTQRMGVTDSLGRFRIDSVPAGSHSVELFHDVLDTLGLSVRTEAIEFTPDSEVPLVLGIPSGLTIVRAKCGASAADQGAIMGMVLAADSDDPLAGVNVRLAWTEITVSRDAGIRQEPHQSVVLTDAAGRFKLCGLPNELRADISAERNGYRAVSIPLDYDAAMLLVTTLFLPSTGPDRPASSPSGTAAAAARGAQLRGLVVDSAGLPVAGAHIGVSSGGETTTTDSTGRFALSGLASGSQTVVVRRVGYVPAQLVVHLSRRTPRDVVVRLGPSIPMLESVVVEATRNIALERVGFAERKRTGAGRYLSPSDLARRHAVEVSDLMRLFPPLRPGPLGGSCTRYWVDGMRWPGDIDDFVSPSEIAAMEVYPQAFAPSEFRLGIEDCRVVVIWTKWKLGIR